MIKQGPDYYLIFEVKQFRKSNKFNNLTNFKQMKLISWNVNGIRAAVGKEFLKQFEEMDADIFCLQETKAQDDQVKEALSSLDGYHIHSNSAEKKGYSGVCTISK